jgi:ABC-type transport system substrate-binding protein
MPTLDVTLVDTKIENNSNDTVLEFLFRGLLHYSVDEKKLVGDLAACGIDNFPTVRCTLNKNAIWNDGSSLTTEDIIATYDYLRENAKNDGTKSRLAVASVSEDKGDVVFQFKTRDATTIDILMLPILRKSDIAEAKNIKDYSFSGPYTYYSSEE